MVVLILTGPMHWGHKLNAAAAHWINKWIFQTIHYISSVFGLCFQFDGLIRPPIRFGWIFNRACVRVRVCVCVFICDATNSEQMNPIIDAFGLVKLLCGQLIDVEIYISMVSLAVVYSLFLSFFVSIRFGQCIHAWHVCVCLCVCAYSTK